MIQKLLFLLLFISPLASFGQEHDCAYFKTGQFRLAVPAMGYESMIERDDTTQTEYNKETGDITKYKVEWIDDCSYEIELIETTNKEAQDFLGTKFGILITEIEALTYTFDMTILGTGHTSTYQMTKIE